ncbi:YqgQ family protein [Companilactobacillus mishanensis]|uniref:YqgQ family protein n=1 Tax=Companilactobacillus mishanensis TaxID=2486008 RepID=UPI001CDC22B3|nr:YqgQ family protein [Companilactobacillus mishanensis]
MDNKMNLRTMYDVQQLLKKYGTYVHLGKRIWDIELMSIELRNIYKNEMIDKPTFIKAQLVLKSEHRKEEKKEEESSK